MIQSRKTVINNSHNSFAEFVLILNMKNKNPEVKTYIQSVEKHVQEQRYNI